MTTKSLGRGFKLKGNKVEKVAYFPDASAAIRAKNSKKIRAVPPGKINAGK